MLAGLVSAAQHTSEGPRTVLLSSLVLVVDENRKALICRITQRKLLFLTFEKC